MVVSKLTIDIPALRGVAGAGVDDFQLLAIDVDVPVDLYRRDGTEGNGVGRCCRRQDGQGAGSGSHA